MHVIRLSQSAPAIALRRCTKHRQLTVIGEHRPECGAFAAYCIQNIRNIAVAWLAHTVEFDQRAHRAEANTHRAQHTEQRRFHDRAPMRDSVLHAHADQPLNQAEPHQWSRILEHRLIFGGSAIEDAAKVARDAEAGYFGGGVQRQLLELAPSGIPDHAAQRETCVYVLGQRQYRPHGSQSRIGGAIHQDAVHGMGVEAVGLDALVVLDVFERVLYAIDLVAYHLRGPDELGGVSGKAGKVGVEARKQRVVSWRGFGRLERRRVHSEIGKRVW